LQLRDKLVVVDLSLADSDLNSVLFGVPQMDVIDILQEFVVTLVLVVRAEVMRRIERQSDPRYVVAKIANRIGIIAEASDMAFHPDADSASISDRSEFLKMFDFLVKRGPVLAAGYCQRDDLRGLGQVTNLFEAFIVSIPRRVDFDVETANVEPVGVANLSQHLIEILDDAFRWDLIGLVVEFDLDGGKF